MFEETQLLKGILEGCAGSTFIIYKGRQLIERKKG